MLYYLKRTYITSTELTKKLKKAGFCHDRNESECEAQGILHSTSSCQAHIPPFPPHTDATKLLDQLAIKLHRDGQIRFELKKEYKTANP